MDYQKGKWICPECNATSKEAYIEALNDYFLLIKPSITTRECQSIFQIPTTDISRNILISLNLPTSGHTKKRLYHQWPGDKSYVMAADKIIAQQQIHRR